MKKLILVLLGFSLLTLTSCKKNISEPQVANVKLAKIAILTKMGVRDTITYYINPDIERFRLNDEGNLCLDYNGYMNYRVIASSVSTFKILSYE